MKMNRNLIGLATCLSLWVIVGCGPRLSNQQVLSLDANDIRTIIVDPAGSEQTVTVSAKAAGSPVNVFVYLSEDDEEVDRAITLGQSSDKIIASQTESTDILLEAKIPADKEASVRLQTASPETATVTLVISN